MLRHAAGGSHADLIQAVHKNNELWTILASDLASYVNGVVLPVDGGYLIS